MTINIGVSGGQGLIGQGVLRSLVEGGRIDQITCFDLETTGRIEGIEEKIVDIYDKELMLREFRNIDLIINMVGPYYKHGTVVADAAFEAGINYTDACADIEITEALLAKDEQWKSADLTLLTGLGSSPGHGSLLARTLAAKFDKVLEIHIVWVTGGQEVTDVEEESGTLKDFIIQEFGEIPTYKDGKIIKVRGFIDGAEVVKLGDWTVNVYHSGHTEPITMPRYFPGIRTVTCKGNVVPFGFTNLVRKAVEIGLSWEKRIKVGDIKISPLDFLVFYLKSRRAMSYYDLTSLKYEGGGLIRVVGLRNGKEETEIVSLNDISDDLGLTKEDLSMARTTAVPIAVVSEAIALGEVKKRGAYAPEALDAELAQKLINEINNRWKS